LKNRFDSFDTPYKLYLALFLCILGCNVHAKDGVQKDYYATGVLKSVKSYQNGVLNGITREYYEVGTLKHAINYKNNQINGIYNTYYPNGALWMKEVYKNGTHVGRKEYNEEGEVIKEEGFGKD